MWKHCIWWTVDTSNYSSASCHCCFCCSILERVQVSSSYFNQSTGDGPTVHDRSKQSPHNSPQADQKLGKLINIILEFCWETNFSHNVESSFEQRPQPPRFCRAILVCSPYYLNHPCQTSKFLRYQTYLTRSKSVTRSRPVGNSLCHSQRSPGSFACEKGKFHHHRYNHKRGLLTLFALVLARLQRGDVVGDPATGIIFQHRSSCNVLRFGTHQLTFLAIF